MTKAAKALQNSQTTLENNKPRYDEKSEAVLTDSLKLKASTSSLFVKKTKAVRLALKGSSVNKKAVRTENSAKEVRFRAEVLTAEIGREQSRAASVEHTEAQDQSADAETAGRKTNRNFLQSTFGMLTKKFGSSTKDIQTEVPQISVKNEDTGSEHTISHYFGRFFSKIDFRQ
ncbi:hypothetical protein FIV00_26120 [Labrenzia sp. THAF82]|uniref:hypothetical protein n=1 Tax=Labrenzia sp. THAF82 TaxID=2587861 RepID=UPI001267DC20|nr:hypothetical protein [Labrenzia sp. THAF82]QFT34000.1 hypothetical protein FIV00_26120 [Labrenzia sp. THAF82]